MGTIAGGISGGGSSALAAYGLGGNASQLGGYQLSAALAGGQMGEAVSQEQESVAELQNQTGYSLANELLAYQGTGLQSQGLAQQATTAAQQQGIEQAQYGVQSGQYPEQMQQAALANANAVQGMQDQGAISGTTNTQGYRRAQATQGAEYGWQQADIFRQQQLAALGQASEQAGYGGQQSQLANQQQQLGLAAQGEGLSSQQAQDQLMFGMHQAGISATGDIYGYMQQAAQAEGGAASTYAAGLSQAALYGGLSPAFVKSLLGGQ
jgi:hypothetical protein